MSHRAKTDSITHELKMAGSEAILRTRENLQRVPNRSENSTQLSMETETTNKEQKTILDGGSIAVEIVANVRRKEALLKAGALQNAIYNSASFSSIATGAKDMNQIFNVGAERMLGVRGCRCDEQDHAGRNLRSAGSYSAHESAEAFAVNQN